MSVSLETGVLAWVLTYLFHSTVLFTVAWMAARLATSPRVREVIWRAALFGPILTSALPFVASVEPLGGRWLIEGAEATRTPAAAAPASIDPSLLAALMAAEPAERVSAASESLAAAAPDARLRGALVWLLALGALATGALTALTLGRLLHHRRRERTLASGPLVDELQRLRLRAGITRRIRLHVSRAADSPFATGLLRPRIVLPERALVELDAEQQRAMLAHELGHLVRLDPLWLAAARVVETMLFVQPFNRVARVRLAACAEFLCDDWAVEHTGDRLALARCLTDVAGWILGEPRAIPGCSMAGRRSPLGARIERILDDGTRRGRGRFGWSLLAAGAVAAVGHAAPAFHAPTPETTLEEKSTALDHEREPTRDRAAVDVPAILGEFVSALEAELALLDVELTELRDSAAAKSLDATVSGRVEALTQRARDLRRRADQITSLAHAWRKRSLLPRHASATDDRMRRTPRKDESNR